jgi:hypothetical protein
MSFQVGDKVYWSSNRQPISAENLTSKDIENLSQGLVKFISEKELGVCSLSGNRMYSVDVSCVYKTEDIELRSSALQKEYEKIQKEVAEKIKAGVDLIKQAQEKLDSSGYDLIDDWELSRPIRGMIDNLGWSSSSLSC